MYMMCDICIICTYMSMIYVDNDVRVFTHRGRLYIRSCISYAYIHVDDLYMHMYHACIRREHAHTYRYMCTHSYTAVFVLRVCVCMYVCVCVECLIF